MLPALFGAGFGLACASSHANAPKEATVQVVSDDAVRMTLKRIEPGRPPLARLRVDVHLHNAESGPRWFLLPKVIESSSGGVDGVEVSVGGGVVIGRFHGAGGMQALLLPAGATIELRALELQSWSEELPNPLAVSVRIGTALSIGGEPAEAWMGESLSTNGADVAEEGISVQRSRFTPDRGAVPVVLTGEKVVAVTVGR